MVATAARPCTRTMVGLESCPADCRCCVARRPIHTVFPVDDSTVPLAAGTRVATAGSCFAQRITENLESLGLQRVDREPGPEFLPPSERRRRGYWREVGGKTVLLPRPAVEPVAAATT